MDELRLALRRLLKRPAATLASITTLGCAIAAAAVTWSALSAVMLKPLPVRDPATIVVIGSIVTTGRHAGTVQRGLTYPYYPAIRGSGRFESTAALWPPMPLLVSQAGEPPHSAQVAFASHGFLGLLGVEIAAGRDFTAADDRRGAAPVAILSERYWRRRLNSAPDAVARTIVVNGASVAVVGVAPRGFRGISLAEAPDIFIPLETIATVAGPRMNFFAEAGHDSSPTAGWTIVGRSRQGSSVAAATAQLADIRLEDGRATQLGAEAINQHVIPVTARPGMTQFSRLLAITVGLLLLIGCSTVGMLLLIRTEARREEFAMCMALGASRARLARGIAFEGALLAAAGALLSLPLAASLFGLLVSFQLPGGVDIGELDLRVAPRTLAAVAAAAATAVLVIALAAGVFGFRADVAGALRSRSGATPSGARHWRRTLLAAGQVAVAMFLLTGAGLFARSLAAAMALNSSYDPSHLVLGGLSLSPYGYDATRAGVFFEDLRGRLNGNAAIRAMAYSLSMGSMRGKMPVDGVPRQFVLDVGFKAIDERYFATLGLRILAGRDFSTADGATAPPVAVASESFARLLAPNGTALGRRIGMPYSFPPAPPPQVEIVGIVPDVVTSVAVLEPLMLYMPLAQQRPAANRDLLIRASAAPESARREAAAAIRQMNPAIAPDASVMYTLQERLARQMGAQRFGAAVLFALGGIAVLLTALGTYVLTDSMATRRMREMGIRSALGATQRQLGSIVLTDTARLVTIGLVAGLGLAWLGTNAIRSFLFQVRPLDPLVIGATAALILVLTLLVSLRAALRAARVDLSTVLKSE